MHMSSISYHNKIIVHRLLAKALPDKDGVLSQLREGSVTVSIVAT